MLPFFDYDLPARLIAQHPTAKRDESRLLVVRRDEGAIEHRTFRDLPDILSRGDLLVLNDTKVLPARLVGHREKTGGKWEGLFLNQTTDGAWEMMAKTRGHPNRGTVFVTLTGLKLTLWDRTEDHHWLMRPQQAGTPLELLKQYGHIPLPPYIRKGRALDEDEERYQTVYAQHAGSVAAPTAGLHFTPELFDRLKAKGIETAKVTLHVGLGTFAPMKVDDPAKHVIHREWCEVTQATVDAIRATKARERLVVAVGTTTTRTLESAVHTDGLQPFSGETGLFIRPPFEFQVTDALVTNFHLPRTTLLLLVGAFVGSELLRKAYIEAIANGYRFYSYGDAMLVLK
jgi:S-adenosylmethionine:tRNA ribosyltransferase-isomerase